MASSRQNNYSGEPQQLSNEEIEKHHVSTKEKNGSVEKQRIIDKSLTTVHNDGLEKISKSKSYIQTSWWVFMLMVAIGITTYEVIKAVNDFYESPIVTSYKIVAQDEIKFPQFYLCPALPVRKTYLNDNPDRVQRALELGPAMLANGDVEFFTNSTNSSYVFNITQSKLHGHSKVFENDTSEFLNETYMAMGTLQDDMFVYCQMRTTFLSGVPCKNITRAVLDPVYGKCFLVDINANPGRELKQVIPAQGLTLIMTIKSQEFPTDEGLAPKFHGLIVSVASQYDLTGYEQYLVPAGTNSKADIRATHSTYLNVESGPAEQLCNTENDFQFEMLNASYNEDTCKMECYMRSMVNYCGCLLTMDKIFLKPSATNKYPFCTLSEIKNCTESSVNDFDNIQNEINECSDKCYMPCESWNYDIRVSSMPLEEAYFKRTNTRPNTTVRDFIYLHFSFPFMEYDEFTQDWSMSINDMIGTIGSQFGLWVGTSVIVLIQIPIAVFSLCCFHGYAKVVSMF